MKRLIALVLIALLAWAFLTGCTPDEKDPGGATLPALTPDKPNTTVPPGTEGPNVPDQQTPPATEQPPAPTETVQATEEAPPPQTTEEKVPPQTAESGSQPATEETDEEIPESYVVDIGPNAGIGGN